MKLIQRSTSVLITILFKVNEHSSDYERECTYAKRSINIVILIYKIYSPFVLHEHNLHFLHQHTLATNTIRST